MRAGQVEGQLITIDRFPTFSAASHKYSAVCHRESKAAWVVADGLTFPVNVEVSEAGASSRSAGCNCRPVWRRNRGIRHQAVIGPRAPCDESSASCGMRPSPISRCNVGTDRAVYAEYDQFLWRTVCHRALSQLLSLISMGRTLLLRTRVALPSVESSATRIAMLFATPALNRETSTKSAPSRSRSTFFVSDYALRLAAKQMLNSPENTDRKISHRCKNYEERPRTIPQSEAVATVPAATP